MPKRKVGAKSIATKYRLHQEVKGDSFAERWMGEWEGTPVVVKYLKPLDEKGKEIWQAWGKSIYRIRKTQVPDQIQIPLAWGLEKNAPYVVLPFEEGEPLSQIQGKLDEKQLAHILLEMSEALSWLHNQWEPVFHHTIHPGNIFQSSDGKCRLLDLGLTGPLRLLGGPKISDRLARWGYLAPEYFDNSVEIGPEADIFALGASLYQVATGELPLGEGGGKRLFDGGEVLPLPAQYSPRFNQIIQVMMAKGPDRRPDANTLVRLGEVYRGTGAWKSVSGFSFAPTTPYRPGKKINVSVPEIQKPKIQIPPVFWKGLGVGVLVAALGLGAWSVTPTVKELLSREGQSVVNEEIPENTLSDTDATELGQTPPAAKEEYPMELTVKEFMGEYLKLRQMLSTIPNEDKISQSDKTFLRLTRMKLESLEDEMQQRLDYDPKVPQVVMGWKQDPDAVWVQDALGRVNRYLESLDLMDL